MINFEEDLLYTKSNEWAKNIDGIIRVGIDDYSQASLGDIVHVEISPEGSRVKAGEPFGKIEATKSVSDINSPVSGVIVKVNDKVLSFPQIVNISPFSEGWLAEIQPDNISQLDDLMSVESYKKFIS